jgi:hypothetical protein
MSQENDINVPSFSAFLSRLQAQTPIQNQTQLAQALQVGKAAISLAKHKDQVPAKWIFTLAEMYSLNSDWLATGKGRPIAGQNNDFLQSLSLRQVLPEIDPAGDFKPHPQGLLFSLVLPRPKLSEMQNKDLVCLRMPGPCMEPEIKDQDVLLIDRDCSNIYADLIYAVGWYDSVLIRRLEKFAGLLIVYADNPICPKIELEKDQQDEIRILGRILANSREF